MSPVVSKLCRPSVLLSLLIFSCLLGFAVYSAAWAQSTGDSGHASPLQEQSPDIVGGREAAPGAWPWQVALIDHKYEQAYDGFFCGGTLIASEWVLTAAHCVAGSPPSSVDVLVGTQRLSDNRLRVRAERIITNGSYSPNSLDGDVALIHLAQAVTPTLSTLFTPASDGSETDYLRGTVTGWGDMDPTSYYGVFPDALQEVALPLIGSERCAEIWDLPIDETLICAGYPLMNKSACYGDSGGPLMVQREDGQWLQIAIVLGVEYGCTGGSRPNVYTRVAPYKQWIAGCIADAESPDCNGADAYEPDDAPQSASLYSSFGVTETHTFHDAGDQDWIKFDVQANHLYQIRTSYVYTGTSVMNTVIWLFDEEGRRSLAYNDDMPGKNPYPFWGDTIDDSMLTWLAKTDGRWYVSVENLASTTGYLLPYGPDARYSVGVDEYQRQLYLPEIQVPLPTPTTWPPLVPWPTDAFGNPIPPPPAAPPAAGTPWPTPTPQS